MRIHLRKQIKTLQNAISLISLIKVQSRKYNFLSQSVITAKVLN